MKIPSFFVKILCNLSLRGHWTDHLSREDTYHDDCSAWDESASSKRLRQLPLCNNFDQGILLSCLVWDVWEHWPLIAAASPQALKLKTPPSHKALWRIISHNIHINVFCQIWISFFVLTILDQRDVGWMTLKVKQMTLVVDQREKRDEYGSVYKCKCRPVRTSSSPRGLSQSEGPHPVL